MKRIRLAWLTSTCGGTAILLNESPKQLSVTKTLYLFAVCTGSGYRILHIPIYIYGLQATTTPPKTNMDTQNSHIWKEIHLKDHHFWASMLDLRGGYKDPQETNQYYAEMPLGFGFNLCSGEVEDIRVVSSKAIAFVRYTWRCNAEFAKEAMAGQKLGLSKCILAHPKKIRGEIGMGRNFRLCWGLGMTRMV